MQQIPRRTGSLLTDETETIPRSRPSNEIVDRYPPDAPNADCMVACIMEWGHSQSLDKWSEHPPADCEYIVNVSEFLMYAGLETLFLGPKDKGSHTILFFTFRQNRTTASEQRRYVPVPVKKERCRSRKERQEVNRQKGKAKGASKGQGKTKSKVKGEGK